MMIIFELNDTETFSDQVLFREEGLKFMADHPTVLIKKDCGMDDWQDESICAGDSGVKILYLILNPQHEKRFIENQ